MSKKLNAKQLNQLKYDGVVEEKKEEPTNVAKKNNSKTIKDNYFGTLLENKQSMEDDTIMPKDKEHLTKNKICLNEALMKKWLKVEKKEGK